MFFDSDYNKIQRKLKNDYQRFRIRNPDVKRIGVRIFFSDLEKLEKFKKEKKKSHLDDWRVTRKQEDHDHDDDNGGEEEKLNEHSEGNSIKISSHLKEQKNIKKKNGGQMRIPVNQDLRMDVGKEFCRVVINDGSIKLKDCDNKEFSHVINGGDVEFMKKDMIDELFLMKMEKELENVHENYRVESIRLSKRVHELEDELLRIRNNAMEKSTQTDLCLGKSTTKVIEINGEDISNDLVLNEDNSTENERENEMNFSQQMDQYPIEETLETKLDYDKNRSNHVGTTTDVREIEEPIKRSDISTQVNNIRVIKKVDARKFIHEIANLSLCLKDKLDVDQLRYSYIVDELKKVKTILSSVFVMSESKSLDKVINAFNGFVSRLLILLNG